MIGNPFSGHKKLLAWAVAGLMVLGTACTATVSVETPTPAPPPAVTTSPVPPAGAPAVMTEVRAMLVDGKIDLERSTVDAGTVKFMVKNDGTRVHALAIEGEDIDQSTDELQPGETATFEVTLTPGEYEVYCPVPGHREAGMTTTLTVR